MPHIWVRAEQRAHEERTALMPEGARQLVQSGFQISVENSACRSIPIDEYQAAGCTIVAENSWPQAPRDAIILGLKELPDDQSALPHRHIFFGHAYKGQPDGKRLLDRFRVGSGTLYDLEYLLDDTGRRVAAFGYWAGFTGAAITIFCWSAQKLGGQCQPVTTFSGSEELIQKTIQSIQKTGLDAPSAIIIGALGRVGHGVRDLCAAVGVKTTDWDMAETAKGAPFPEILDHDLFLNCILAGPGGPVFVPKPALTDQRRLAVIGDIACDPTSDFSPIKVYDQATSWASPAIRVHDDPPLDVMAIDNLPSLLPKESSADFAGQLLPWLLTLDDLNTGIWARAKAIFDDHTASV